MSKMGPVNKPYECTKDADCAAYKNGALLEKSEFAVCWLTNNFAPRCDNSPIRNEIC